MGVRLGFDDGFYSLAGKSSRGAAILWKKPWKRVRGTEIRDGEGRIAIVTLAKDNVKVVVASVYAPNLDKTVLVRQFESQRLASEQTTAGHVRIIDTIRFASVRYAGAI